MGRRLAQFSSSELTRNWVKEIPTTGYCVYLACRGDYVYVQGTSEETVQKRNRINGELVWQKSFNIEAPAEYNDVNIRVDNSYNIYTTKNGHLYKYNDDGNLLWDANVETPGTYPLQIFCLSQDGTRIMLRGVDGKKIYTYKTADGTKDVEFTPTIQNENLIMTYSGKLDSTKNIILYVYGSYGSDSRFYMQKWDSTGTTLQWQVILSNNNLYDMLEVDIDDNVWIVVQGVIRKYAKNTGNVLAQSSQTDCYGFLKALSNGDIVEVLQSSSTLRIRRFNTNAVLQTTQTYSNVSCLYRVDVVV